MVKLAALGMGVLIAFVGGLVAMLAVSGNLTREAVMKVVAPEPPKSESKPIDNAGPVAQMLEKERAEVRRLRMELAEREKELDAREQTIDDSIDRLTQEHDMLKREVSALQGEELERLKDVAATVGEMKSQEAAATLEAMDPEQAANILRLIPKGRGKILDSMKDVAKRNLILEIMQEPRY